MKKKLLVNRNESGAVLVISLIMLMLLSIIGVTGMQVSTLEEKMAGNSKDQNIAFQAAESALRGGEKWVVDQLLRPQNNTDPSINEVWTLDSLAAVSGSTEWWCNDARDYSWWTSNANQLSDTLTNVATNPYYVVEQIEFSRDSLNVGMSRGSNGRVYFRVTAIGTGGNDNTQVLLQSSYTKRF